MLLSLEILGQILTIAGFAAAVFRYVVLKPLQMAIGELRNLIQMLIGRIERDEERQHSMEVRLAGMQEQLESAFKRINRLENVTYAG